MSAHSSPNRSTDSSPSSRRAVCIASSKRFIAIWRNTVAIWSSRFDASSASRSCGSVDLFEQAAERDRLAEHRRGLGQRQRRRLVEHALPAREVRVQAVAELVREREHVAAARRPVQQHVRVVRRHRVRAERARAACPGRAGASIHAPSKNVARGVGELARERRRTRRARAPCASSQPICALDVGDRRHAVVVGEAVDAEQLRLQRVPALRDRVAALHRRRRAPAPTRRSPRSTRLRLAIHESKWRRRSSIDLSASSVLSTNARVRSPGSSPSVTASAAAWRTSRSGACSCASAGLERGRLAVELDADRRHLLLEQPLPRAAPGDRLLGEDDLFGLGQQVRPVAARRAQVVRGEREPVVGEQRLDLLVGELGPLELEEQQLGADHAWRAPRPAACARRARDRWCRSRSRGRRSCPARPTQVVHLGEPVHERREPVGVELARPGRAYLASSSALASAASSSCVEPGVAGRGQQRREIPDDVGGGQVGVGRGHEPTLPSRSAGVSDR